MSKRDRPVEMPFITRIDGAPGRHYWVRIEYGGERLASRVFSDSRHGCMGIPAHDVCGTQQAYIHLFFPIIFQVVLSFLKADLCWSRRLRLESVALTGRSSRSQGGCW
jgi:hypothetical protein